VAAGYDWGVLARRILAVYETVVAPGGGEVTVGEDDDDLPEAPPIGAGTWPAFLRRAPQ
jgi:phosphatidylinositol alpha-mannosyltransferase